MANFEIKTSEFYYTGGGIWVGEGQFSDGTFFVGSNGGSPIDFDLLTKLPYDEDECAFYYDEDDDFFIRHLEPEEANELWLMLCEIHKDELFGDDYNHLKSLAHIG